MFRLLDPPQASSVDFLMQVVESDLEPPSINGQLAVLEAGADNLTQWPYIAHRPDGYYGYSKASAWVLDTSTPKGVDQLLDTLLRSNYPQDLTGKLGEPAAQMQVPSDILSGAGAPQWSELQLALPPLAPGNGSKGTVAVLQMCCSQVGCLSCLLQVMVGLHSTESRDAMMYLAQQGLTLKGLKRSVPCSCGPQPVRGASPRAWLLRPFPVSSVPSSHVRLLLLYPTPCSNPTTARCRSSSTAACP